MPQVKLQSVDGTQVEVSTDAIALSTVIKTMLQVTDLGNEEEGEQEMITLPNVNGPILWKVVEWCKYHKDDPSPVLDDDDEKETLTNDIPSWDQEFLRVDQSTLFEIILAANYLDIKGLLDVSCKTVANMMKGKSPEEVRTLFNIKNDFTHEEEEQIRKENLWCED